MIADFKIIRQILPKNQKKALMLLSGLLFIGMLFEILGLGILYPILTVLLDPEKMRMTLKNITYFDFSLYSYNEILIFSLVSIFVVYLSKTLFLVLLVYKQNIILENVSAYIQKRLYSKYLFQSYKSHLYKNLSQMMKEVQLETIYFNSFCRSVLTLIVELALVFSIVLTILFLEPKGAMAIGLIFGSLALLYFQLTKRKIKQWGSQRQSLDLYLSKILMNSLSGIKEVKLLDKENFFLDRFTQTNTKKVKVATNHQTLTQISRFYLELITIIGMVSLILILISNGVNTSEIITLLGVFVAAAFRMIPSINRILAALQNLKYYSSSIDVISKELFDSPIIEKNKSSSIKFKNKITIDNLDFSYKKKKILEGIHLVIQKGETIGIVGESGSGKSTFVDLLNGLLKPTKGTIKVDDRNIEEFITSWQLSIGYVGQEIFLIDDTIRANIAFGIEDEKIDHNKINQVLKASQLSKFICELENGVETMVGDRGIQLSGGQRQRIGIARALYHNPSVLIFDEATASLDDQTEKQVMKSIYNLKQNKTMIIIAHRISTLNQCDKIYKIQQGQIKLKEKEWIAIK
ncbi:ABC transporter ATP-binding protein/permease [Flavobacteriaceae bacterium]|nr:ABC transporter ATP-binding protein/permease [Flavobacteriaceae bacterium]